MLLLGGLRGECAGGGVRRGRIDRSDAAERSGEIRVTAVEINSLFDFIG